MWREIFTRSELTKAKSKYRKQVRRCSKRVDRHGNPILMLLSFEEWMDIWWNSGHWYDRGTKRGQFCMCRFNDLGNYEIGNVKIATNSENLSEAHDWMPKFDASHLKGVPRTQEVRDKIGAGHKGKKHSPEWIEKMAQTKRKPCTIDDGITIWPSLISLTRHLGKDARSHPNFRYLDSTEVDNW